MAGQEQNGDIFVAPPAEQQADIPLSELQYTVDGGALTPKQRQDYERDGFIVIKNLVPNERIAAYRQEFEKICAGEVFVKGMTVMKDVSLKASGEPGEKIINKIQSFQNNKTLFEYCTLQQVTQYVKSFTGPDCMEMHTMLINKPPDAGTKTSRHPMHQDLHYFPFRPANRIVCAWTAMEKVHRGNGCLVVVPGTHKGVLEEHVYPEWQEGVNKAYHGIKGYDASMSRQWVDMEEGDTVFFHPILLHGSGTNRTKGFRKAISCHYASSHCHYIDVTGTSQQIIADEVLEIVAMKLGKEVAAHYDYTDFWKERARLVCGKKDTM